MSAKITFTLLMLSSCLRFCDTLLEHQASESVEETEQVADVMASIDTA